MVDTTPSWVQLPSYIEERYSDFGLPQDKFVKTSAVIGDYLIVFANYHIVPLLLDNFFSKLSKSVQLEGKKLCF